MPSHTYHRLHLQIERLYRVSAGQDLKLGTITTASVPSACPLQPCD